MTIDNYTDYDYAMEMFRDVMRHLDNARDTLDTMHNVDKIDDFDDTLYHVKEALSFVEISRKAIRKEFRDAMFRPSDDDYVPDYNESAEASSHLGSMGIG